MVWPFGSSGPSEPPPPPARKRPFVWSEALVPPGDQWDAVREWAPLVMFSLFGMGALQLYAHFLRRIPGADYIRPSYFRTRSLYGRVTSVGDGDNFHLFHTPGGRAVGWGWLRRVPQERKELKDRTIPIRIAGVDAPEGAHFGRPGQPFATDSLTWLSDYILRRDVRAYVYRRDQYNRIVATVYVRRWLIRRDVGLEMLKRGLATVYESKIGAEFGGMKVKYEKAEAKAKAKRKGMWSGKASDYESPGVYKAKHAAQQAQSVK
ncbi:nuclease domain containing protein [Ophiocordyceps camponoti-floridani]|uniref:Probable endonuclease LCL3 n=1 Tax=Ophiocordyceps camponoti-floridani TaxID=2030778 RepID=A0A8H4Q6W1_9HYPO|nr:nuclease domain containing protein [Ophiocordyceps camponoti-floridani]